MEKNITLKNGTRLLLRSAEEADAAAFAAHLKQCGGETDFLSFGAEDCPHTEESCRAQILTSMENPLAPCLFAFHGSELVGEVCIHPSSRRRFSHVGELAISITQDFCSQGLGTILMREILALADSAGYDSITLTVDSDNAAGIRLYKNFGFVPYGHYERAAFYRGGYHSTELMARYKEVIQ